MVHGLRLRVRVADGLVLQEALEQARLEHRRGREHRPRGARQQPHAGRGEARPLAQLAHGAHDALAARDVAEDLVHDELDGAGQRDARREALEELHLPAGGALHDRSQQRGGPAVGWHGPGGGLGGGGGVLVAHVLASREVVWVIVVHGCRSVQPQVCGAEACAEPIQHGEVVTHFALL